MKAPRRLHRLSIPHQKRKEMKVIAAATLCILMALATELGAAEAEETKTASGILITTMKEGSGASPKSSDVVKVHYRGTLTDGKEFDSSYKRGQAATFPLNRVIRCWTEGVQTMKLGGKAKLQCPPNLAYGSRGVPGTIPPDATLLFEIELLEIVK
jgi:FKBP-type peptidyl-prolyl cis-trans isomerase FkpA